MIDGIGIQESTAIRPAHPAPFVYGRGGFLIGEERRRRAVGQAGEQAGGSSDATDATGLARRPDEVAAGLDRLRREHDAAVHERAYVAAGRRGADHGAGAASASLVMASPSGLAEVSAREAGAREADAPEAFAQAGRDRAEPGDASASDQATSPAGGAEARSAERTFMGGGSGAARDEHRSDPRLDPGRGLTEEEKLEVRDLQDRDREVRAHEQAHLAASGGLAMGGASFRHERGPDGRMYAVAGEVNIDTSEGANPDDTIAKARRIRAAAMAPAQPSGQDRQVAAQAAQMEASARVEKSSGNEPATSASAAPLHDNRLSPSFRRISQRAGQAYARAAGNALPDSWGSGIAFAV